MTENSRQKNKYFKNKKNFSGEIKSIFHHFLKGLSKSVSDLRIRLKKLQVNFSNTACSSSMRPIFYK